VTFPVPFPGMHCRPYLAAWLTWRAVAETGRMNAGYARFSRAHGTCLDRTLNGGSGAPARKDFVTFRGKVDRRRAAAAGQTPVSAVKGSPGWGSLAARGLVDRPIGGRLSDGQRRAASSYSPSRQTRRDRRGRLTRWHACGCPARRARWRRRQVPIHLRGWRVQARAQGPAGRSLPPATRGSAPTRTSPAGHRAGALPR
jgi:hypothetical protein